MVWFVFQLGDKLENSLWAFSKEVGAQKAPEIPHITSVLGLFLRGLRFLRCRQWQVSAELCSHDTLTVWADVGRA